MPSALSRNAPASLNTRASLHAPPSSSAQPPSTADASKKPRRIAVYPGSFDPVTRGHLDVARRARPAFDHLIIAVGHNSSKATHLFTVAERVSMLRAELHDTDIEVDTFEGLLAHYAAKQGATVVVRGLRGWRDWAVEAMMMAANFVLGRGLRTHFVDADPKLAGVSSTKARDAAAKGESLDAIVTPTVARQLRHRVEHSTADASRQDLRESEYLGESAA